MGTESTSEQERGNNNNSNYMYKRLLPLAGRLICNNALHCTGRHKLMNCHVSKVAIDTKLLC